jgi:hypothetical protein
MVVMVVMVGMGDVDGAGRNYHGSPWKREGSRLEGVFPLLAKFHTHTYA